MSYFHHPSRAQRYQSCMLILEGCSEESPPPPLPGLKYHTEWLCASLVWMESDRWATEFWQFANCYQLKGGWPQLAYMPLCSLKQKWHFCVIHHVSFFFTCCMTAYLPQELSPTSNKTLVLKYTRKGRLLHARNDISEGAWLLCCCVIAVKVQSEGPSMTGYTAAKSSLFDVWSSNLSEALWQTRSVYFHCCPHGISRTQSE